MVETENPRFLAEVLKSRKRFEALRAFTLESGREEIERLHQRRKDGLDGADTVQSPTRSLRSSTSADGARSPPGPRGSSLSNVPEEGDTFTIGDDEDSDEEHDTQPTPSQPSPPSPGSRAASRPSSADDTVPAQLRGMSEKARGKLPADRPYFQRISSTTSINSNATATSATAAGFTPSPEWVRWIGRFLQGG
jgi:hypothetical protein